MRKLSLKRNRSPKPGSATPDGHHPLDCNPLTCSASHPPRIFTADCSIFRGHKVLGEIVKVHQVGLYYVLVEHHVPSKTCIWFHPFYDPLGGQPCVDLDCDFMDMDDALLVLIAHRRKIKSMGG